MAKFLVDLLGKVETLTKQILSQRLLFEFDNIFHFHFRDIIHQDIIMKNRTKRLKVKISQKLSFFLFQFQEMCYRLVKGWML